MKNIELKPCPWCGHTDTLSIHTEANSCTGKIFRWYAFITCSCFDDDSKYPIIAVGLTEEKAKDKAKKLWNTRMCQY